jgi:acyl-CoA thioesterase FadM
MNLIFRMIYVYLYSLFRERINIGVIHASLPMIVLPNDLDLNMHMNDGRYITICDLSRIDIFIRTGLAKAMLKRHWIPVIAEHTMVYKKSLHLFERYTVLFEMTHWDDKFFYMNHTFMKADRVVALGTSKGAIRSREGVINPADVIAAVEQGKS